MTNKFKIGHTVRLKHHSIAKDRIVTQLPSEHVEAYGLLDPVYPDDICSSYQEDNLELVSDVWKNNNIDFNRWFCDMPLFLKVLELSDFQWVVRGSQYKYLTYTVDTRQGNFVVSDRDGNVVKDLIVLLNDPV